MENDLMKEKTELMIKLRELENNNKKKETTFQESLERQKNDFDSKNN